MRRGFPLRGSEESALSEPRLIVVSNRLPLTLRHVGEGWRASSSSGGLVTALEPVIRRGGGLWVGWPGDGPEAPDAQRTALLEEWERTRGFVAVELPPQVATRFYHGYANRTLWPLFHEFPSRMEFSPEGWAAYREANERFRDALVPRLRPGDQVWVHDYQLMLLPRLLREAAPAAAIGFFLHIPFPSSDVFAVLPRRQELIEGLLGADCVAFQTYRHLQHFRSSLIRILGLEAHPDRLDYEGRSVRLEALPIGIVPDEFTGLLDKDAAVAEELARLRERYRGRRLLLAVDRLDYTKGLPERLRTFRRLLEQAPELRGKVVLLQIAVPSRERIGRYAELKREVNELVGEINGHYGTPDWTPVLYIRRSVSRAQLVALYAAADVGWVTPLRDGMNLVAKEYVACQVDTTGVLLLSEFAGAAAEMGEAFLVNPYDEERTAETLQRVLALPEEERRERMAALRRRVLRNTAVTWAARFLEELGLAVALRGRTGSKGAAPLPTEEAVAAFAAAPMSLLLLDYDGTLVPVASRPAEAVPPPELLRLLERLATRPRVRVALVSGRTSEALDRWLGGLDGLWLAAEHGALMRPPGGAWEPLRSGVPEDWKGAVQPVLEHFVDRTPGSFIELKAYSLVWHFRMADPEFGEWLANELLAILGELLAGTELVAVRDRKSIEVRHAWATKGDLLARLEAGEATPGFRLAIGDDHTDEELFDRLPDEAWTVRVGDGLTRARYRLKDPAAVMRLLSALAEARD